eukprot:745816-Alexandrium_andersonii.AAC.1
MQQNLVPRPPKAPPPPAVLVARARLYNTEAATRRAEQTEEGGEGEGEKGPGDYAEEEWREWR